MRIIYTAYLIVMFVIVLAAFAAKDSMVASIQMRQAAYGLIPR